MAPLKQRSDLQGLILLWKEGNVESLDTVLPTPLSPGITVVENTDLMGSSLASSPLLPNMDFWLGWYVNIVCVCVGGGQLEPR